jgi:ABC-type transport system involved in cytochrome bd biosynthesis fused ATPase/permease subunit
MISSSSMTVLVIAHRLSTIRNAEKILVIKGGEVVEAGTHAQLLERGDHGEYARLVQRQMQGGSRPTSQPPSAMPSHVASTTELSSAD